MQAAIERRVTLIFPLKWVYAEYRIIRPSGEVRYKKIIVFLFLTQVIFILVLLE